MAGIKRFDRGADRTGSGATDHPVGLQRPYKHVTAADKAKADAERKANDAARGAAIRKAERHQRLREAGIEPSDT